MGITPGPVPLGLFRDIYEGRDAPSRSAPLSGSTHEKHAYLVKHSDRPVYFSTKADDPGLRTHELAPRGLLYEAVVVGRSTWSKEDDESLWGSIRFRPSSLDRPVLEFGNDLILADYHAAVGRRALANKETEAGLAAFQRSIPFAEGLPAALNNLGGYLAESELYKEAIPFLRKAIQADPNYEQAVFNLAKVYHALEDYKTGYRWIRIASDLRPQSKPLRLAKARAYAANGKVELAHLVYESIVQDDEYNAELREEYKLFLKARVGGKAHAEFETQEAALVAKLKEKAGKDSAQGMPQVPNPSVPNPLASVK